MQGHDVEPMTPLGRLLRRSMNRTGGARMPPNLVSLDGWLMAGTLLTKDGKVILPERHPWDLQRCGGMHQQKLGRGEAAGKGARQPSLAMAAPLAGLGTTCLCTMKAGGKVGSLPTRVHHPSSGPSPQFGRERGLWGSFPLPASQAATYHREGCFGPGDGEPSCLLWSQHSLRSCCGSGGHRPLRSRRPCSVGGRGRFRLQALPNMGPLARWGVGERVVAGLGETLKTPCRQRPRVDAEAGP